MTLSDQLKLLQDQYCTQIINLDSWHDQPIHQQSVWLEKQLIPVYKPKYNDNERVVFTLTRCNNRLIIIFG